MVGCLHSEVIFMNVSRLLRESLQKEMILKVEKWRVETPIFHPLPPPWSGLEEEETKIVV